MARITVEDCVKQVPNRFELVVLAAHRAQAILSGGLVSVDRDDKEVVLALREIAEGKMDLEVLRNAVIERYRSKSSLAQHSPNKGSLFSDMEIDSILSSQEIKNASAEAEFDIGIFADQNEEAGDI